MHPQQRLLHHVLGLGRHCPASGRRSRTPSAAARRAARSGVIGHAREPLPPARVRRAPAELALGLRVGRAPQLGHHHHSDLSGEQPPHEAGHVHRLLGTQRLRQDRQPLGDLRGLVVDDVVDPAAAALDRRHGRLGRVGDVDERPHPAAVADHRELALADRSVCSPPGRERRARPVETAVAQHDSLGPRRREDRLLDVADRRDGLTHLLGRTGSERVLLGLHRSARALVGREEALRDEPLHAHGLPGREQVVGALGPQPVGHREARSKWRRSIGPMEVSWWTITSGCARPTASATWSGSSASATTGSAPGRGAAAASQRCGSSRGPRGPPRPAAARAAVRSLRWLLRRKPSSLSPSSIHACTR